MPRIVHENELFKVEESEVTIKDKKFNHHKIIENDTVVILPVTRHGYILLENQYRPGLNGMLYELPSGHIENGEDMLEAAKRELEEETGFKAGKITFMTYFYSSPGIISKKESLYLAENLTKGITHFDSDEEITVKEFKIEDCLKMIESNEIIHAPTIIALLYFTQIMQNKAQS